MLAEGVAAGETDGGFVGGVVEGGKGWHGGVGKGADEAA